MPEESCRGPRPRPWGPRNLDRHHPEPVRARGRLSLLRRGSPLARRGPASARLAAPPSALARRLRAHPLLPPPPAGPARPGRDTAPPRLQTALHTRVRVSPRAPRPPAGPQGPPPRGTALEQGFLFLCTSWLGDSAPDSQGGFLFPGKVRKLPLGLYLCVGQGRGGAENKRRNRGDPGGIPGGHHS